MMVKVKAKNGRIVKPTGVTLNETVKVSRYAGQDIYVPSKRMRPRNPKEAEMLKKWEKERGGKKIGTI